jgi:hypothetical protein
VKAHPRAGVAREVSQTAGEAPGEEISVWAILFTPPFLVSVAYLSVVLAAFTLCRRLVSVLVWGGQVVAHRTGSTSNTSAGVPSEAAETLRLQNLEVEAFLMRGAARASAKDLGLSPQPSLVVMPADRLVE